MLKNWSKILILFGLLVGSGTLVAQESNITIQPKTNSPFSRFGLGDPIDQFFAGQSGMAGLSAAFRDPYQLNLLNPASLSALQATAFEVGVYGKYSYFETPSASDGIWSGNLNYMALGFPLKNPINKVLDRDQSPWTFGMAIALQPYTIVGYDVETTSIVDGVDQVSSYLKGTGGTYRFQWGNAAKYKDVSVGVNIGYIFGKITNSRRIEFDSLNNYYNSEFRDDISVGGFTWNAGVQYIYYLKKAGKDGMLKNSSKRIVVGAYGNSTLPITTKSDRYYSRANLGYGTRDTILFEDIVEESGQLPTELTIGLAYEDVNKFRLGLEYHYGAWSEYQNDAKEEVLMDTWRIKVGGEFIPDIASYNNYLRRVRYRAGFSYGLDPRSLGGEQLTIYNVSLGFGFPIIMPRQQISFVNFGVEAGQFGVGSDILTETYVKMTLGFTLNDNSWFFKRKFN